MELMYGGGESPNYPVIVCRAPLLTSVQVVDIGDLAANQQHTRGGRRRPRHVRAWPAPGGHRGGRLAGQGTTCARANPSVLCCIEVEPLQQQRPFGDFPMAVLSLSTVRYIRGLASFQRSDDDAYKFSGRPKKATRSSRTTLSFVMLDC